MYKLNIDGKHDLYCADCFEVFPLIPDKSVDLILADLPYEVTRNKLDVRLPFNDFISSRNSIGKMVNLSFEELLLSEYRKGTPYKEVVDMWDKTHQKGLWAQYDRVIKDDGVVLLFGQGLFYVDLVNSNRKNFRYDIVWDKKLTSDFLNATTKPMRIHEQIAVFYKKKPYYNPQFTQGKPLHSKGHSFKDKEHKNQNYGEFKQLDDKRKGSTEKYPTTIFSFQKPHPSKAIHRTEKPVSLLECLIKTYTREGDVVLDNTMGSGSTIKAADNCGRRSIGIEMNKTDFDNAVKRLENDR